MKILKTVLYLLLAVVLVLVLLGFAGPKNYHVERSIEINAPVAVVSAYLKSLKKQNEWGPWRDLDTTMKVSYEGVDGTVGSVSSWEGKSAGKGKQEIKSISEDSVITDLIFYTPFGESKSTGFMKAAESNTSGSATDVTWGFRGENNFIARIFGVFMSMEKGVGPMFAKGLDSLKAMVERDLNAEYDGQKVQVIKVPPKMYITAHQTIPIDDLGKFFAANLPRIAETLSKAQIVLDGPSTGLYYTWDEDKGETDVAVGFPVKRTMTIPETEIISLPGGSAVEVNFRGTYDKLGEAHEAIDAFVEKTGLHKLSPAIEEYITDPRSEPDTAKWLTKVYYLLDQ